MPKFRVNCVYRGNEGYTVEAATPQEAKRKVLDGETGEHDYDEYIERESIQVFADGTDELLLDEEVGA